MVKVGLVKTRIQIRIDDKDSFSVSFSQAEALSELLGFALEDVQRQKEIDEYNELIKDRAESDICFSGDYPVSECGIDF